MNKSDELIEELIHKSTTELEILEKLDTPSAALAHFNEQVVRFEKKARINIPDDFPLGQNKDLKRTVYDYKQAYKKFSDSCSEARKRFDNIIEERFEKSRRIADYRKIMKQCFSKAQTSIEIARKSLLDTIESKLDRMKKMAESTCNKQLMLVEDALKQSTESETLNEALNSVTGDSLAILGSVERAVTDSVATIKELQERIDRHIEGFLTESRDMVLAAQTEKIEELREKVDTNLELVQLGLSVEIIDHDLNRLYRGIHAGIARLKQLVRNAPNARQLVEGLGANFQHMEQRYKLMSPLYRGSYRIKDKINGQRIIEYTRMFLEKQIDSTGIRLNATKSFLAFCIMEVPAVILPVFVNIVDNSIYWLHDQSDGRVVFDVTGNVVTVCDNGRGIHETQLDDIFEPFYTTKPGGRGLGLYIAKANLNRYNHKIWATNDPKYHSLPGACFCISFQSETIIGDKNL